MWMQSSIHKWEETSLTNSLIFPWSSILTKISSFPPTPTPPLHAVGSRIIRLNQNDDM